MPLIIFCILYFRCMPDINDFMNTYSLTLVGINHHTMEADPYTIYRRITAGHLKQINECPSLWPELKVYGTNLICPSASLVSARSTSAVIQATMSVIFVQTLLFYVI